MMVGLVITILVSGFIFWVTQSWVAALGVGIAGGYLTGWLTGVTNAS